MTLRRTATGAEGDGAEEGHGQFSTCSCHHGGAQSSLTEAEVRSRHHGDVRRSPNLRIHM